MTKSADDFDSQTEQTAGRPSVSDKWQEFAERSEKAPASPEAEAPPMDEAPLSYTDRTELENRLTAMEQQVAEYRELSARLQADMDNLRKRTEREVQHAHRYGVSSLLQDLIPVLDSMVRALQEPVAADDKAAQALYQGLEMTLEMLNKTIKKHGVETIDPEPGQLFDPDTQEAMSMVPTPGAESNTVVNVLQKGYRLHDRVIRAAMVVVAQ